MLFFGCATYIRWEAGKATRREEIIFYTPREFWDWVYHKLHKRIPTWMFAHNLPFDLSSTCVWKEVVNGTLTVSDPRKKCDGTPYRQPLFVADDPPTIIEFLYTDYSKLVCVDTLNYWRSSLDSIGKELGFPKGRMPNYCERIEEWIPYCKQDVAILERAVCELASWLKDNDYGGFRFSAPSIAFSAYRHRFMHHPIEVHGFKLVSKLERESYFGGRLECFYIGQSKGSHYEVDVAALYPYVMRENTYPTRLLDCRLDGKPSKADIARLSLANVARVRIKTNRHVYPVKRPEGLCHCHGEYVTTLAGPELMHAVNSGVVQEVYAWSRYQMDNIFEDFVEHFWNERRRYEKAGESVHATFCKLMMNSLYGKFGQQNVEFEFDHSEPETPMFGMSYEYDDTTDILTEYRHCGDRVDVRRQRDQDDQSEVCSPVISSYVTAYGREHMRKLRGIAGEKHTYYIATDALYVDQVGYDNLDAKGWVKDRTPGKLSVKHSGDELSVSALHQLSLGDHILTGSLKKSAVLLADGSYQELHFEGLNAILQLSQELPLEDANGKRVPSHAALTREPLPGVCIYPVIKRMSKEYRKGVKTKSGWVKPITLTLSD